MNGEQQLKLQAFLDGELPEGEAREMAAWIQRDHDAAALAAELKNTRQALAGPEPGRIVPETREFYWSKIERGIQGPGPVSRRATRPSNWAHVLWPIGAVAVCFIVVLLESSSLDQSETAAVPISADTPVVEAMQPGSDATTYHDEADGTTLVWFSEPTDTSSGPARTTTTF